MKKLVLAVLMVSCGCAFAQNDPFAPQRPAANRLTAEAKAIDVEVERAYWAEGASDEVRVHLDQLHGTLIEMQMMAGNLRYSDAQCSQLLARLQAADIVGQLHRENLLPERPTVAHTVDRVGGDLETEAQQITVALTVNSQIQPVIVTQPEPQVVAEVAPPQAVPVPLPAVHHVRRRQAQ